MFVASLVAVAMGVAIIAVAVNAPSTSPEGSIAPSNASGTPTTIGSPGPRDIGSAASAGGLIVPTIQRPAELEIGRAFGRSDAPATLTVWGDFQCPFCGRFARQTEPRLIADYVVPGSLRIVYRDWVFIGVESVNAAVAARCASDQGRFWAYHDFLLWNQQGENEGGFSDDRLDAIAESVGLDKQQFKLCTLDTLRIDAVRLETEAGNQLGIGMTPTLVVGAAVMPGAATSDADYARLRDVIDAAVAAGRAVPSGATAGPS